MKAIVGYDRDFGVQFFRRTFAELTSQGIDLWKAITEEEREYIAQRLGDTLVLHPYSKLGSPWISDDFKKLFKDGKYCVDRVTHDRAELMANQILIYQGIVSLGGIWKFRDGRSTGTTRAFYEDVAAKLFRIAARWPYLNSDERRVLNEVGEHTSLWIDILAQVMGNDYLEELGTGSPIVLA